MVHLRLVSTVLPAVTCLLMIAGVSSETVITCEGKTVNRLNCDRGVIRVQAALYGRANKETCSEGRPSQQLANTECSQKGALDILRKRCDGKSACEVNTDVVHNPDPCRGIYKYLEVTYTCYLTDRVVLCENAFTKLSCDEGQTLTVYSANYGRRDRTTCSYKRPVSQVQNVKCLRSTSKVAESCNGKKSCAIRASNSVFGDPCVGTYKYLEVVYACQCQ